MSAWEIAQKHRRRHANVALTVEPLAFWRRCTDQPGVRVAQLTAEVLVASATIDGLETKDPVDRMLVALAEAIGARLITGDARILAFLGTALPYGSGAPRAADLP